MFFELNICFGLYLRVFNKASSYYEFVKEKTGDKKIKIFDVIDENQLENGDIAKHISALSCMYKDDTLVLAIIFNHKKEYEQSVLAHEAVHIAEFVSELTSIDDGEFRAYLVQHIFSEVDDFMCSLDVD